MVFAAIGLGFKSKLVVVEGNVDADKYLDILNESETFQMLNYAKGIGWYIFMQDGAPAHRSSKTFNRLKQLVSLISQWPPNSPDCNRIEMVWAIMKAEIKQHHPTTIEELWRYSFEAWDRICQTTIDLLVLSFRFRLELVIVHNGKSITDLLRSGLAESMHLVIPFPDANVKSFDWIQEMDNPFLQHYLFQNSQTQESSPSSSKSPGFHNTGVLKCFNEQSQIQLSSPTFSKDQVFQSTGVIKYLNEKLHIEIPFPKCLKDQGFQNTGVSNYFIQAKILPNKYPNQYEDIHPKPANYRDKTTIQHLSSNNHTAIPFNDFPASFTPDFNIVLADIHKIYRPIYSFVPFELILLFDEVPRGYLLPPFNKLPTNMDLNM
jgi:hypothetical protein